MTDSETPRLSGTCRALFLGPNPKIRRDLTPMLAHYAPGLSAQELVSYPSRQDLAGTLKHHQPTLCFLDVLSDQHVALPLIGDLLKLNPKLPVIAVLGTKDADLIMRCLRQGARDVLLQPFTNEQVEAAVRNLAKLQTAGRSGGTPAKIYCVMPAKGGCGASTVACSLACQWKRMGSNRVLLADLDPLAGTQSFLLKGKSNYSFMDVLNRQADIDSDLWKAMIIQRQGVDVLLAPEVMLEGVNELTDAASVIEYARHAYDIVVLDAGGVYGDWNLSQAHLCDELLLVTTNELTALQAVQRAMNYLESNRVGRWKVKLVVNRYDRHVGLSRDVIGTALQTDIYYLLPSDYDAIQKALMEGKTIPSSSDFGKGVIGLTDRLAGREEGAKKGSSMGSLFSLFSRTQS
jgi:pilus assembly protein CpaE